MFYHYKSHQTDNQLDVIPVRLIGLVVAPLKTFKKLSTPDKESFSKTPKDV
jgi:hypothetical protein